MRVCRSVAEARLALRDVPRPVGFVPTMGALHEGHATLFRRCTAECATAVASIFVNPLQFDDAADLDQYPRTWEHDLALLESLGVAIVFAPGPDEMYPDGFSTTIDVGPLATLYEGSCRPGHFAGVATVVLKLLLAIAPDRAYFGQKDAQQVAVIAKLIHDLDLGVTLVPVPTVRDPDGLALSSRNARLGADERKQSLGLSQGLFAGRDAWAAGERDSERIIAAARDPGLDYEYLAVVDSQDFGPPQKSRAALLVAAVLFEETRLIDNVPLNIPLSVSPEES